MFVGIISVTYLRRRGRKPLSFWKTAKSRSWSGRPLSYQAPIFFVFFLVSDFLLAYFPFSLEWKLFIGIFGFCLPLGIGLFLVHSRRSKIIKTGDLWRDEFL